MTTLVANSLFDMNDLITNGSLAEFFEFGVPEVGTATEFVVGYSDEEMSEQLTLGGNFADYDAEGYPTSGTITSASYMLNGVTIFTLTDLSISVEAFTDYVLTDNLAGLFEEILAGEDELFGSTGDDVLLGFDGDDALRGDQGSDELYGGNGNDLLSEYSGIDGPFGNDLYDGGEGIDRVSYFEEYGYGVTIDLRNASAQNVGAYGTDTLVSIEHITATYGDDTLIGNDAGNWFWTFNGLDRLSGNGGDDLFTVGLGDKVADGGAGTDTIEILDLAFEPLYTADGIVVSLALQGQAQATGVGNWTLTGIENLGGSYGSDELTGDANANILAGYEGEDDLAGGAGNDTLTGDGGYDIGYESAAWVLIEDPTAEGWLYGSDYLDGGAGDDRLFGSGGDDLLIGGADNDLLDGGSGLDMASYGGASAGVTVDLRVAAAQNTGGAGTDTLVSIEALSGSSHGDVLTGDDVHNELFGHSGDDYLFGNGGNDTLDAGAGLDRMYGGAGDDSYAVSDATDYTYENAGEGYDIVYASVSHALRDNVEELMLTGVANLSGRGNDGANIVTGNAGRNDLIGYGGDDRLYGEGGNDELTGGAGLDRLYGGIGNDVYVVSDATDYIYENVGEGYDVVYSSVDVALRANIERLNLTGSAAVDGRGNDESNTISGNLAANVILGQGGDDYLYGQGGDDRVEGGTGNDRLDGGSGLDRLIGGEGDDIYIVRDATDYIYENAGEGYDRVYSAVDVVLRANIERLYLTGSADIDGRGNDDGNIISGNSGANTILGQGGDDFLYGVDGNDTVYGGLGNDRVYGGDGDDFVNGGTGDDQIEGGAGLDLMYGELGADLFVFRAGDSGQVDATADRVIDFSQADGDVIHLGLIDGNTTLNGDQAFTWMGEGLPSGAAGELRYVHFEGNTFIHADANGDGLSDFVIRLDGLHTLESGDFVL